jgi:hypothetical protein
MSKLTALVVCLVVCALFGLSFGQENDFRGTLSILQRSHSIFKFLMLISFISTLFLPTRPFQRHKGTLSYGPFDIDPKSKGHNHSHIPASRRGISRSIPKLVSSRASTQHNLGSPLGPSPAPTAVPSPSLLLTSTVAGHPPPQDLDASADDVNRFCVLISSRPCFFYGAENGKQDVVVAYATENKVVYFSNQGDGLWSASVLGTVNSTSAVFAADLNGTALFSHHELCWVV